MSALVVPATDENIARAAEIIRSGGLVVFPTETVYGLGADAGSARAVRRIFEAKGRPSDNPLIVHVAGEEQAASLAHLTDTARALMRAFWPGPLSIVLETRGGIPPETTAGLSTSAFRMPMHRVALELIRGARVPIAAPSANRSGRPSPTDAASAAQDVGGEVDLILDGGPTEVGVESTVVDARGPSAVILREGGISRERLSEAACVLPPDAAGESMRSPGTRHRHYAPSVPLVLWRQAAQSERPDGRWSYIGMELPPAEWGEPVQSVICQDADEYARQLFRAMRELEVGADMLVAEWPEGGGIGAALRDRLARAAGERCI